jgi:LPXTG-site transpeptidase (sortase) family protein
MASKKGIIPNILERSDSFAIAFALLFAVTFSFLYLVGATPDSPTRTSDTQTPVAQIEPTPQDTGDQGATPVQTGEPQVPVKIKVSKIGLNAVVSNPASTDVDVLDEYLLKGAVRYPTSAPLGVNGTVLLFGHSSYLPIVHNQNYKAFDGIQNLKNGDIIDVYSADTDYQYAVTGVRIADANNDIVELPQDGQHLTLVTCDSFATKSNRFVVTADLVGTSALEGARANPSAEVTQAPAPTPVATPAPVVGKYYPLPQPEPTNTAAVARALFLPSYPPGTPLPQFSQQQVTAAVSLGVFFGLIYWL